MKTLKKPLALMLFICLAAIWTSQNISASTIIDEGRTGTISIYKYAVDDLNDYDTPATGEEQTIDLPAIPTISFTVTRVLDDDTDPATATPLEGEGAYEQTAATNENGLVEFTGLALGTYRIHEEEHPAVQAPVADFLVSVPMTNAAGDAWIYDIFVYPKNELADAPDVDIFITDLDNKYDSLKLRSVVNWYITSGIPASIGDSATYRLNVDLDGYLPFTDDSVSLYHLDDNENQTNLTATTDFTIGAADNGFEITLTPAGRTALADAIANQAGTAVLYTQFRTEFIIPSEDLPDALGTEVSCDVTLDYASKAGLTRTSNSLGAASVYAGGINLLKVNGRDSGETLAGATFKIYPSENEARRGENAITAPGGVTDWTVTTLGDGTAAFYGLSYGGLGTAPADGATDYYLVETVAPAGYNLLRAPQRIRVDGASHNTSNAVTISNSTGFTLPITGGSGTTIITLAGLLLIILALTLYYVAKKRRHEI